MKTVDKTRWLLNNTGMRILVVHKNGERSDQIATMLRGHGHIVDECSRRQVIEISHTNSAPDLILCSLPQTTAENDEMVRLTTNLNAFSAAPFIGMAEAGFPIRQAMQQGWDDIIVEPFTTQDLLNALESRMKRVHQLTEPVRKRLEKIQADLDEIRRISEITIQINTGLLVDDVLNRIFDTFRSIIPYNRIGLALLESGGTMVRARFARTDSRQIHLGLGYTQPMQGSSLQTVLATQRPRVLNDLEEYLRQKPESASTALIVKEGFRSSLTCPLVANGKTVGFLFFTSYKPNTYQSIHTELFTQIASQLSVIVEKAKLYQELFELHEYKNKLIGILAHDIRNPMSAIKMAAELLLDDEGVANAPSLRPTIELILSVCQSSASLLDNMLDITMIESGKWSLNKKPIKVIPFLQYIIETQSMLAARKNIKITYQSPEASSEWVASFDPSRVQQILENLLSNAVKYAPPDSSVEVWVTKDKDTLCFAVRDHGQGIAEAEMGKLFQEFSKTSARPTAGESSAGLGLAIVRKLVEAHGGKVWAESTVNQGSCFYFTIPSGNETQ